MIGRIVKYPWNRFLCQVGGAIDLSDGGYLVDPLKAFRLSANASLKQFDEIADLHSVVLLGEPGIGKSVILEQEFQRLKRSTCEAGPTVVRADLRDFGSEDLLVRRIFEGPEVTT